MKIILNQEICYRRFNSSGIWCREDRCIFTNVPWTPQWENQIQRGFRFRISRKEKTKK